MEPQAECEEVESDSPKWEVSDGPPEAEFAENGSSELIPKSAILNSTENQSDSIKEGPYQNCRILAWWQDVHKPEQGWWVKVFVDGQYKWVPYQEVYAPAAKRRRRSKSV